MSSLNGINSLGGEPLCCNGKQEKRPLLRGEVLSQSVAEDVISPRDIATNGTTAIIQIPLAASERAELRYKPEKLKTVLAFVWSATCLTSNLFVLAFIHERVPDRVVAPLPDIFFSIFPEVERAFEVSEIIIIASVWTCILLMVLHRYRWIVFRRVFTIMGALYAMRAITMLVTQVPLSSTSYHCSKKAKSTSLALILERVMKLLSGFGLSINGQHTYCGDYIFSGHTLILTMCFLIIKEYSPQRCRLMHILFFWTSFVGIFLILLSRSHYTIDVILGYYVTTRVFWIYHSLCASQLSTKTHLSSQTAVSHLSRVWWYPLFHHFEKNVTGPLPRQYEWPLPWPRKCLPRTRIS